MLKRINIIIPIIYSLTMFVYSLVVITKFYNTIILIALLTSALALFYEAYIVIKKIDNGKYEGLTILCVNVWPPFLYSSLFPDYQGSETIKAMLEVLGILGIGLLIAYGIYLFVLKLKTKNNAHNG